MIRCEFQSFHFGKYRLSGSQLSKDSLESYIRSAPFNSQNERRLDDVAEVIRIPPVLEFRPADAMSTQEAFGRIMTEIGKMKSDFGDAVVTISPDVATSTNLGGFLNQRGVFGMESVADGLKPHQILSARKGVACELGISDKN